MVYACIPDAQLDTSPAPEPDDNWIHGGAGNDFHSAGHGSDHLYGDAGDESLHGGDGVDFLYGGDHNDALHGEGGGDTLHGNAGNDLLYGGHGKDLVLRRLGKRLPLRRTERRLLFNCADNNLLPCGDERSICWVIHPYVLAQLISMTGGDNVIFLGNDLNGKPKMKILNCDVIVSEKVPALGTANDVTLCDVLQ